MDPANKIPAPERRSRKILIVDDDRLNIRILGGILRNEGYVLAEADSGEHGMEAYEKFQPDLVLLDVMMPGIDGFETCRRLKQIHGDNCAPIIFITARNESDDVVAGLTAGGVDYLPKPFKARQVLARIRTHLQNQILAEQQKLLVEQLNKADAAKNRFLGMAAHDLRNPLSTIRGLSEILRESTDSRIAPADLELLDGIHDTSQSMLDLVDELLDLSVIESGEFRLEPRPCSLTDLIAKCAGLRSGDAAKKRTRIVLPAAGPGIRVTVDPAKMQQVVDNLLSNAVKYSPPGSTVTVVIHGDSRRCGFAVQDQGPGIPEKERHRLFSDFGRLSVKPTGGEKSTGLGLAICRKIVEAHQGTITAENLPGRGCQFSVALPVLS
jgi:signal transduction histidine kinase